MLLKDATEDYFGRVLQFSVLYLDAEADYCFAIDGQWTGGGSVGVGYPRELA